MGAKGPNVGVGPKAPPGRMANKWLPRQAGSRRDSTEAAVEPQDSCPQRDCQSFSCAAAVEDQDGEDWPISVRSVPHLGQLPSIAGSSQHGRYPHWGHRPMRTGRTKASPCGLTSRLSSARSAHRSQIARRSAAIFSCSSHRACMNAAPRPPAYGRAGSGSTYRRVAHCRLGKRHLRTQ